MTERRRRIALVVVACVMVLDILDLTIVNVALPALRATFAANDAALQWMVAGYASTFAVLLVSGGRLGDIYGYRRMIVLGLAGFCAASVGCGLAPNASWLVIARLAQGVAAALMLPQIMAVVQLLYSPQERIGALGLFGVLGGAAAVSGPVVGGLIIGADLFGLGWRPIFLVNLPLGLVLIAAAARLLPDGRSAHAPKLDLPGTLVATVTLATVMLPLVEGRELGWPWWAVVLPFASPLLALALWRYSCARMTRDRSALLIPDLFELASYRRGAMLLLLFQAAMAGLLFTLTLTLQQGLGFSATDVGVAHIPFALGSAVGIGAISRRALPRFGPAVLTAGALGMATGVALLVAEIGWLVPDLLLLAPPMALAGLGMGLVVGPLTPVALSQVDVGHAGGASGLLKSAQELGGALGVAVLGGVFLTVADPLPAFIRAGLLIVGLLLLVAMLTLRLPRDLPIFATAGGCSQRLCPSASPHEPDRMPMKREHTLDHSRALVIGGGIGGLTAAIALRAKSFAVDLIERDPDWTVYGVGIIQQGNVVRAMAQLGLIDDYLQAGVGFDHVEICIPTGQVVARIPSPRLIEGLPANVGIGRRALQKVLGDRTKAAGATVRLGVTAEALDDDGDGISARFSDGGGARYDFVIGADGLYSQTRELLFPGASAPAFTGQAVWRYNFPRLPDLDALRVFDGPTGVGLVPLSDTLMYMYVTTPEPGNPRYPRDGLAAAMREKLAAVPAPLIQQLRQQIIDDAEVVYKPLEWLMRDGPWHKGRVVLLGDAVHATTPHLGQGAGMAIEDSIVLADELARGCTPETAFEAYQARRVDRCRYIVEQSRAICFGQLGLGPPVENAVATRAMFAKVSEPI